MYYIKFKLENKLRKILTANNRLKQRSDELKLLGSLMARTNSIPRFTPGEVMIHGYSWKFLDYLAFAWEYKYIFVDQDYFFTCNTREPRIIDAGGHVGLATLYFKRLYPAAQVLVFEPLPDALSALQKNMETNGLTKVQILPYALWTHDGKTEFNLDEPDAGNITVTGQEEKDLARKISVPTCRLFDYLCEPTHFLKMNIEGSECDVISDCGQRLQNIEQMVISYHSFERQPQRLHILLETLHRQGFRYLIQHFDVLPPPFELTLDTRFFLWIYAIRNDILLSKGALKP